MKQLVKSHLVLGIVLGVWLLGAGMACAMVDPAESVVVGPESTIVELAHAAGVRGGDMAEALGLARQVDKHQSLQQLGVTPQQARAVLRSLAGPVEVAPEATRNGKGKGNGRRWGEEDPNEQHVERAWIGGLYNYLAWPLLMGVALWWLLQGGRKRAGRLLPVTQRYAPGFYRTTLVLVVLFFGFASGKSPNPMEGLVKVVKAWAGFYPDPLVKLGFLAFFSVLALLGGKLLCGWGCPFGALQELLYDVPVLRACKKRKLPFKLTMTVRTLLFAAFVVFAFGWIGRPWVIYHGLNPFNLFSFEFKLPLIIATVVVFLLLSLAIYRPFCQLICPFGWYAWFLEKVSLTEVRIDHEICVKCGACEQVCPLDAAKDRVAGKAWPADCFSCARCLRVCPVDAIDYGPRWKKKSGEK
jgi:polyferredoxin